MHRQAEFGALYGPQNVAISGIHTHSGPGGYLQYLLYDITSLGFVRESFDALVDGIVLVSWPVGIKRNQFDNRAHALQSCVSVWVVELRQSCGRCK